ncbi:hypothetical protein ABB37_08602 [Leptomonas pyrrhocoris]|uniref:AATF leucine zipper-containing domain-containing protein n=1 Tax=Leptomonas pyrrhocoris TaxID=157538 RepID=A0A0N0VDE4_LEPPY|nr:hypothetical protein ABB37_08602 [Leptomonas pyrrhocoris]KPA75302.1 hypothetical protein ABB37_08602 [Leptomonas pyrrhocoris]|eukprot:XP_015653741.1 hypothetical protein ABB37_08602 [Leptomonas pyrrhocoris]
MPRFASSPGHQTLVTLKHKKKSLADAVNEQLTASTRGGGGQEYAEEGGVAEDFDFSDTDIDNNGDVGTDDAYDGQKAGRAAAASGKKAKGPTKSTVASSSASSRLRHRGPLDTSLSEGKYAAVPVNVEAAMDDIFGALDMGDMEAEGEEMLDGEDKEGESFSDADSQNGSAAEARKTKKQPESATRKRRRAKDLTEDEYAAWFEQKSQKEKKSGRLRRPLSFGADGGDEASMNSEEADIFRQLNELRRTQHVSLVPSADAAAAAATTTTMSAAAAVQSDAKGTRDAVQRFIMVYGQLLRLRVLLQPALTRAISVPQYYAHSLFVESNPAVEQAAAATAATAEEGRHLVEQLAEQREAAAEKYEELQEDIKDVLATLYAAATGSSAKSSVHNEDDDSAAYGASHSTKSIKRAKVEEVPTYRAVERYHERVLRHADICLDYWGAKLVQANSAKLKTISQPLPQQIAAILIARSRLRAKVQKNRSHMAILAHPEHVRASSSAAVKAQRALHIAEGDVDAEIYDDADFLRELVRRGGVVANQLEQKVKDMQQALLPSREGARKGFHRVTKGKAVNYEPRPKLVGFTMAESLDDTQRNDVVVNSLFQ